MGVVEFIEPENDRLWSLGWNSVRGTWSASYEAWPPQGHVDTLVAVRGYADGDRLTDAAALLDWMHDDVRVAIPSEVTDLLTAPGVKESPLTHRLWSGDMIGAPPWQVGSESQRWDGYLDLSSYDGSAGSYLLANKVGAGDYDQLREREDQFVATRLAMMPRSIPASFDLDGLKEIHAYLFQDVYPWAGETRTVNISKGVGAFSPPSQIGSDMGQVSDYLAGRHQLRDVLAEELPARLAATYNAVNAVHAFREGNGRTQREFISAVARHNGHKVDWTKVSEDQNNAACESGRSGDLRPLESLFAEIVTRAPGSTAVAAAAATPPSLGVTTPGPAETRANLAAAAAYLSSPARTAPPTAYQAPDLPPARAASPTGYRLGG